MHVPAAHQRSSQVERTPQLGICELQRHSAAVGRPSLGSARLLLASPRGTITCPRPSEHESCRASAESFLRTRAGRLEDVRSGRSLLQEKNAVPPNAETSQLPL